MAFIEIPVSNSILATYNTDVNRGLFVNRGTELEPNWFFHLPFPHDTKRDPKQEKIRYGGLKTAYIETIPKPFSCQIETRDSRVAINDVLELIDEESDEFFPIYDWAWPNKEDREVGYTIRNVFLKLLEPLGALFNTESKGHLNPMGWRIQLEAINYDP